LTWKRRISPRAAFAGHVEFLKCALFIAGVMLFTSPVLAVGGELTGRTDLQLWHFQEDPLYEGQELNNISLSLQPEYYHEFDGGSNFSFVPFFRYDAVDSKRTHFDIREMNYHLLLENIEFRAGIGKVFWGATEFVHLVDIINQTDLVENPDGEDKLGQPIAQVIKPFHWGTFEFFVLPYFRERTFPGEGGRFRSAVPVDTDNPAYEHSDEDRHIDIAARLSATAGITDIGFSYFIGTSREPTLQSIIASDGSVSIIPFYEQIEQVSVDLQTAARAWLLKLESFYRSGQGKSFYAYSTGFEYTLTGVWGLRSDLGVIGEYAYDDRKIDSASAFQNDVMLGLRLVLNDISGTELLLGYIYDIDYDSKTLRIEGSRRFGDNIKLSLEAGALFDIASEDILYDLRNDDYVMLSLSYYL
jgi:hypothetical protein